MGSWNLLLLINMILLSNVLSSKILFVGVDPDSSRMSIFSPIIKELLYRGHEVTAIVSCGLHIDSDNYNEILVEHENIELIERDKLFLSAKNDCFHHGNSIVCLVSYIRDLLKTWEYGRELCASTLNSSSVVEFLNDNSELFDVVISDFYAQEVMSVFAQINQAPLILMSAFDEHELIYKAMGAYSMWSTIPQLHGSYDRDQNFIERFINRVFVFSLTRLRKYVHIHYCNTIIREFFEDFATFPSVREVEKKVSLILFNNFEVFGRTVNRQPGVLDIGGVHVFPVKPLSHTLKKILDKATEGVIYVNLGSMASNLYLNKDRLEALLSTFRKSKLQIIWRFENRKLELPKNVFTRKQLPQNSILSHDNIKLFISIGDSMSVQESILHRIPMIVIPSQADHIKNALKIEEAFVGNYISEEHLTFEYLTAVINKTLTDPVYQKNLEKIFDVYDSGSLNPLNNAVFWIEHIIEYGDSEFLRPDKNLVAWYEYLFLDTAIILFLYVYLTSFVFIKVYNYVNVEQHKPKSKSPEPKSKIKHKKLNGKKKAE